MAEYRFITTWRLRAPIQRVWDVLSRPDRYGEWWPSSVGHRSFTPQVRGVGQQEERIVRGRLPIVLRFATEVTGLAEPHFVEYRAWGDLEGGGRVELVEDGDWTEVTVYWNVRTTQWWINVLGPLARPLLAYNHHHVMRQGQAGLARLLGTEGTTRIESR
jgi:uncharacterized protein YndB with AHSA1/START domain